MTTRSEKRLGRIIFNLLFFVEDTGDDDKKEESFLIIIICGAKVNQKRDLMGGRSGAESFCRQVGTTEP